MKELHSKSGFNKIAQDYNVSSIIDELEKTSLENIHSRLIELFNLGTINLQERRDVMEHLFEPQDDDSIFELVYKNSQDQERANKIDICNDIILSKPQNKSAELEVAEPKKNKKKKKKNKVKTYNRKIYL